MRQDDEIAAITHARMSGRGPDLLPAAITKGCYGPEPHTCQGLAWVSPEYPAVAPFEERGIIHPTSWLEYQNNSQIVDLWSRPKVPGSDTGGEAALPPSQVGIRIP